MLRLLVSVLLLSLGPHVQAQLRLPVHALEIANLTYQLDCMSRVSRACDPQRFEGLWAERFLTHPADSARLADWREIRQLYAGELRLTDGATLGLSASVRSAGLQATSERDYLDRLGLLLRPLDLVRFEAVIRQFQPRFHDWWTEEASSRSQAHALGMRRALADHGIDQWMTTFAAFYESDLPENYRLPISLIYRPPSPSRSTSAFMNRNQAVVEFLEGEPPDAILDIVVHEAAHFLFNTMPPTAHDSVTAWFSAEAQEAPDAIAAYQLLDEAVATALGNGLVRESIMADSARWARLLATPNSLYNDPDIDAVAKALLPWIGTWVTEGGTLNDPAFLERYLASARMGLGRSLGRPAPSLRHLTLIVDDSFGSAVRDGVLERFRASHFSGYRETCCSATWIENRSGPHLHGTLLFLQPDDIDALADVGGLTAEERREIQAASQLPVLFGTHEASGAPTFLIVASTDEEAVAALEQLRTRSGPLIGLSQ